MTLPKEAEEFVFPPKGTKGVGTSIILRNFSVDGLDIGVNSQNSVTVMDSHAVAVSVGVGGERVREVVLNDLDRKHYSSQKWVIGDGSLRIINTTVYGWETSAWAAAIRLL